MLKNGLWTFSIRVYLFSELHIRDRNSFRSSDRLFIIYLFDGFALLYKIAARKRFLVDSILGAQRKHQSIIKFGEITLFIKRSAYISTDIE